MADYVAGRVYLRPLLPSQTVLAFDPDGVLRRTKRVLLKRIRGKLLQETFSDAAKKAIARSVRVETKPNSLIITASHPAFGPLVMGQKKQQMTWLTKARVPIPIITETGKLIFRNATARSMADGRWVHPGRKPSTFVEKAKTETREFIKSRLAKEYAQHVAMAYRQAARAPRGSL